MVQMLRHLEFLWVVLTLGLGSEAMPCHAMPMPRVGDVHRVPDAIEYRAFVYKYELASMLKFV